MTAVEDAIAAASVQWDDLRGSGGPILPHVTAVATLTVAINQAVDSGHLIPKDRLEQIGWVCTTAAYGYNGIVKKEQHCDACVPVYRFKGEQP